jgi:hypothetical protein
MAEAGRGPQAARVPRFRRVCLELLRTRSEPRPAGLLGDRSRLGAKWPSPRRAPSHVVAGAPIGPGRGDEDEMAMGHEWLVEPSRELEEACGVGCSWIRVHASTLPTGPRATCAAAESQMVQQHPAGKPVTPRMGAAMRTPGARKEPENQPRVRLTSRRAVSSWEKDPRRGGRTRPSHAHFLRGHGAANPAADA